MWGEVRWSVGEVRRDGGCGEVLGEVWESVLGCGGGKWRWWGMGKCWGGVGKCVGVYGS